MTKEAEGRETATDNHRYLWGLNKSLLQGFHISRMFIKKTEPDVQSSKRVRECDDQKGKLPNNANHFLSFLAPTNIIAMALQHLEEAAWLLTIINLFPQRKSRNWWWVSGRYTGVMENWQNATKMNGQPQFCQGQALHLVFIKAWRNPFLYKPPFPSTHRNWEKLYWK